MEEDKKLPPIYIVSGGKGIAGDIMVQSTLIQFPHNQIPVIIVPDVISEEVLKETVEKVVKTGGIISHTMVNTDLRKELKKLCKKKGVKEIDLMGELSDYVTELLHKEPIRIPGLFRKMNQEYFDRITSIEFTLAQDDGLNPSKIKNADVVLTGVSRAGKTPLSIYMAMFGWKVANVPLVKGIEPPKELFEIDPGRVFGLTIYINNLLTQRNKRVSSMGSFDSSSYLNPREVREELDYAEWVFNKGGFTIIDVTNKPIESTANEIIRFIIERYPQQTRFKDIKLE
jgi:[pyruvate, water dikinase]-phosphate phosphotransferase / [pyruvate, water dikinase] kinase